LVEVHCSIPVLEEEEEEDRQDRRRPSFLRQTAQIPHNLMPWAVLGRILDFRRMKRRRRTAMIAGDLHF
jgi:hypothetical protein